MLSFQPTYEELKHGYEPAQGLGDDAGFQPTYEELKPDEEEKALLAEQVFPAYL